WSRILPLLSPWCVTMRRQSPNRVWVEVWVAIFSAIAESAPDRERFHWAATKLASQRSAEGADILSELLRRFECGEMTSRTHPRPAHDVAVGQLRQAARRREDFMR